MKSTLRESNGCRRTLEVEIPAEEVRREMDGTAKSYARKLTVPGFRKGKTPASIVRQRYQREIREEVIERLSKEYSWKIIDEKKLVPLHQPVVEELDYREGQPLSFRVTFEVKPEFSLGKYKGLEVERHRPPVTDELVEKSLQALREQNARYEAVEGRPLGEDDVAVVDMQRLDPGGAAVGEGRPGVTLDLGSQGVPEEFRKAVIGLGVGETRDVTLPGPPSGAEAEPIRRQRVTLRAIRRKVLPALDDGFAREVGKFESLDALRARVHEDLGRRADDHADREVRERLEDKLAEAHSFATPDILVKYEGDRILEQMAESMVLQGMDPGRPGLDWKKERAAIRQAAERRVRTDLILDEVARAEQLSVSDEEVLQGLSHEASRARTTPAALRARLEKDGRLDVLKTKMLRHKSLDLVVQSANILRQHVKG